MGKDIRAWLEGLHVDLGEVSDITKELLGYYESFKQVDHKAVNELIKKTTDYGAAHG